MFKKKSYFSTLQENNTEIVFTYISERPEWATMWITITLNQYC